MASTFGLGVRLLPPGPPAELPRAEVPIALDDVDVVVDGAGVGSARDVAERWGTRGLVVLHRGALVVDHHAPEQDPQRPSRCYSVTKSITGTVAAHLVSEGVLDRDARVGDVVPALAESGFGDATVGHLCDMEVSLAYSEDYADIAGGSSEGAGHDFGDYVVAMGLEDPGAAVASRAPRTIRALLPALGRGAGPHGAVFAYATPVTDALGWVIEVASGADVVEHVESLVWRHAGAEGPGRWGTDAAGTPSVGAGLEVTTRDLARVGLLLSACARGEGPDGAPSVAALDDVRRGGSADAFAAGRYAYLSGYTYRNQWWLPAGSPGPISGWGIYGQVLWIDPDADVVIAWHARHPEPSSPERDAEQHAACTALVATLAAR